MYARAIVANAELSQRTKFRALLAAWLGWTFDGLDGYLYIMVAIPFVTQLVANEHGTTVKAMASDAGLMGEVNQKAAIIQAVFLVGWAMGGAVFGRIGDRLGRSRTLTLTILTYAIFTGLAFFATSWWHLLIFRFLAALGIGGEWAAGSALVAETLDRKHRAWASATLQSGYITGCILAALSSGWILGAGVEAKWVFLIGVLPAFVTLWIRSAVPESHEWVAASANKAPPRVAELFAPNLRRTTIMLLFHISLALTTVWAFLFFAPQMVRSLPDAKDWTQAELTHAKTSVTVFFLLVNIVANYFATYLAKAVGYRKAFGFMTAGALVSVLWGFWSTPTHTSIYVITSLEAFFGLGMFALFPLYVPPLYPTLLRTLGAGVTYNVGRLVAAGGTLGAGWLTREAGGPTGAVWYVGLLYIPMLIGCFFLPELKESRSGEASGGESS